MVKISQIFLFLILTFSYLKIHGVGIVFLAALAMAVSVYFRYKSSWRAPVIYILALCAFLVLHALMSHLNLPRGYAFGKDQIKILLYGMTNFCIVVTAIYLISKTDSPSHARTTYWVMVVMMAIAVAEVYGPFKPIFDAIRDVYTSDSSIYAATERDLAQYGYIRPTVFTSEPSSVGNFFGALWLCYLCTIQFSTRRLLGAALLIVAALVVFRSPTLVGYVAVAPGLLLVKNGRSLIGYSSLVVIALGTLILPNILWVMRFGIEIEGLKAFLSTGSFFIRQISPLMAVSSVMQMSPVFGAAGNYYQIARQEASGVIGFLFGGFYTDEKLAMMPDGQFVTNATFEFLGVFGVAGCIILTIIFLRVFRAFNIKHGAAILLACTSLWVSHAGIVGAFTWTPLILLALAFHVRREQVNSDSQAVQGSGENGTS